MNELHWVRSGLFKGLIFWKLFFTKKIPEMHVMLFWYLGIFTRVKLNQLKNWVRIFIFSRFFSFFFSFFCFFFLRLFSFSFFPRFFYFFFHFDITFFCDFSINFSIFFRFFDFDFDFRFFILDPRREGPMKFSAVS